MLVITFTVTPLTRIINYLQETREYSYYSKFSQFMKPPFFSSYLLGDANHNALRIFNYRRNVKHEQIKV